MDFFVKILFWYNKSILIDFEEQKDLLINKISL